jgi:endonuclease/exonuclease/phosphatase (EEP) superfamily protein YafD
MYAVYARAHRCAQRNRCRVRRVARQLRLLTANLWNGRAEPEALAELIAAVDPDAVLAQEMTSAQARAIERLLPHGLLLPRGDYAGMGLALRRPASVSLLPLVRRHALVARLSPALWDGLDAPLEIINVHISAPTRLSRFGVRRGQVAALHEYLSHTPARRVLAGDLNSFRLMPAYRTLCTRLRDAALEHRVFGVPTWSPHARWPRFLRLDHVLTQDLRVLDLRVVRVPGSDHSAVLATLSTA